MRTLSSTLLAAQKDPSAVPFVKVTVTDQIADIVRLRWERLYDGTETDAGWISSSDPRRRSYAL